MRTGEHFYKGYAIRNAKASGAKRSRFYIIPNLGRGIEDPIDSTCRLRTAKALIDVWTDRETCSCGQLRLPHEYRCYGCLTRRVDGLYGGRRLRRA